MQINNRLMLLLTMQLAVPIFSTDIYLPSLKQMGIYFHCSAKQIQLTLILYFLVFAIVQLIYGPLSDRFGRKPILLLSLLVYIFATMICIYSTSLWMLEMGRCLQALGAGSSILIFAIIRDLYEGVKAAKWIAFMSAIVALSPIIAPILGGTIQMFFSWQGNFILLLIVALVLWFLCFWFFPETNQYRQQNSAFIEKFISNYRLLFKNKKFLCNALSAAFAFGALFAYVSGSPYILLNLLGYSPQTFGWMFSMATIGYVLGAYFNSKWVSRLGINLSFCIGIISFISGAILMTIPSYYYKLNVVAIIIPQFCCEFGIAIVIAMSITKALQFISTYSGTGSALIGFLRFLLATLSSFLVMKLHTTTALPLAIIILFLAILSLSSFILGNRNSMGITAMYK